MRLVHFLGYLWEHLQSPRVNLDIPHQAESAFLLICS